MKKANFTAVLDIAGFEIFEYNGFEQISINFVNEKLQQFFNHHMFVVEQEEYVTEGIDWAMVDFGMDLAACIIMFEKPMGIWAILEEESLFPKATDKSFEEKLKAQFLGKSSSFAKPQSKTDKNAHFAVVHYAGLVSYNVSGWLEKNKDPVNDTVVDVLKRSYNKLLVLLWEDHPGQSAPPEEDKSKKKKKGGAKTVSSVYLIQLAELMHTLHSTEPHFIRCIVPNTHKQPGMVEPPLIMHQLTCNGVLEGIRICMRGFPNRMMYPDFKSRYQILAAEEIATAEDNKIGVYALMDKINFQREKYRLGHTKVFFRAGALAALEEARDDIVLKLVRWVQGQCFGMLKRRVYQKKADQRQLMKVIQNNFRKYMTLRNWGWFIIIQKTKPLIGQVNIEEELRLLEEKANIAYGAYKEQLDTMERLRQANEAIKDEKKALLDQLQSKQGNLSEYTERQAKASAQMEYLEIKLQEAGTTLASIELEKHCAMLDKKVLEQMNDVAKKDIEDLEFTIQKLEQEKANKDHSIYNLNDEIAKQDEIISKIVIENKFLNENHAKANDDLLAAEEKLEQISKIRSKLEETLNDLQDSLNREKKHRSEIEKQRRKLEGDLKISQDYVAELERSKNELDNAICRKEKDLSSLVSKLEFEQAFVVKIKKTIKEIQARVEVMEEELESEQQACSVAERQCSELAREIEEFGERLNEAGGATSAQVELNKKRDTEIQKLRKDLEEIHIQHESTLVNLKRKHQDAMAEMSDQIDQLSKMKSKVEKERIQISNDAKDARAAIENISQSKVLAEKSNKNLTANLNELNKKVEDASLTLRDFEVAKKKLTTENAVFLRQLQELENTSNLTYKYNKQVNNQLDEAKTSLDNEVKERNSLLGKLKILECELDGMRKYLEDESGSKADIIRQLSKAAHEADLWRQKYESEGLLKAEELEMTKMKLQARLTESTGRIEQLSAKLFQMEKARAKLQTELDDLAARTDQAYILNNAMQKKSDQFDTVVSEWKQKAKTMSLDLNTVQKECRNVSYELFKVKSAYNETMLQLDEVCKENKKLSNEIKDVLDQISEGGRSIYEIDKIRKRLESEKSELQSVLEEAKGALRQKEKKVLHVQLKLSQVRQETECRLSKKDEQFESASKNYQKALDAMYCALEQESKETSETLRIKKKLESDIVEMETSLEHVKADSQETKTMIKRYHQQIRKGQAHLENEQRATEASQDFLICSERKANSVKNALEEARTMLEQADRCRRQTEEEISETTEKLSEQTCQNQAIAGAKRKFESQIQTLHVSCFQNVLKFFNFSKS